MQRVVTSIEGSDDKPIIGDSKNTQVPLVENGDKEQTYAPLDSSADASKLQNALENERKKSADLSKRLLYLQSDFVNSQRQTERRIGEAVEDTKLRYVEDLISLKEDLERAISVANTVVDKNLMGEGLRMLLSRVDGILRADEVERIMVSPGGDFDTRLHEAVAYSEGDGSKNGTIVSVVSNGYTMRGRVIKPALVEVSRESSGSSDYAPATIRETSAEDQMELAGGAETKSAPEAGKEKVEP